jgi:ABC-2 type transport system permease protein
VKFGVVDENRSVESAGLYQSFAATPYFRPVTFVDTRQAEAALMKGEIAGFTVLRDDFSRKVADPLRAAEIGIFVNGVDANNARIVVGYALGAIANWAQGRLRERAQTVLPAVSLEQRYWFNPEIRSANFIVPGLIAMVMTMIGALLTALVVAREWERGTMEAIMVSPATMTEIMLGKLVAYFVLGQGGLAVSVGLGIFVFEVPFRGSFPVLIGISAVFLVVSLAMGLLISTVARNQFVAAQLAFLVTFMPALILSGLMFDIESMPAWIQAVTTVFAARYYVSSLQTLFLAGTVWPILLPNLLALLAFAAVFLTVAIMRTRRSLE